MSINNILLSISIFYLISSIIALFYFIECFYKEEEIYIKIKWKEITRGQLISIIVFLPIWIILTIFVCILNLYEFLKINKETNKYIIKIRNWLNKKVFEEDK